MLPAKGGEFNRERAREWRIEQIRVAGRVGCHLQGEVGETTKKELV